MTYTTENLEPGQNLTPAQTRRVLEERGGMRSKEARFIAEDMSQQQFSAEYVEEGGDEYVRILTPEGNNREFYELEEVLTE